MTLGLCAHTHTRTTVPAEANVCLAVFFSLKENLELDSSLLCAVYKMVKFFVEASGAYHCTYSTAY